MTTRPSTIARAKDSPPTGRLCGPLVWIGLLILLLAVFWMRLHSVGWDGYAALHPDERHMFFVTGRLFEALADPAHADLSLAQWWFSDASPLNPHAGQNSYVYGELPLLVGAFLGWVTGATDWFAFMPVARGLSGFVDTLGVLAVFLGARLLATNGAALACALLYAVMPSAIQLAAFHTVDVWLSAACAGAVVPMIALAQNRANRVFGPVILAVTAGVLAGLAVSTKITGVLIALPMGVALIMAVWNGLTWRRMAAAAGVFVLTGFVVFRLANPFAFAGPGVLGLCPSAAFIDDFRGLADVTLSPDFPPNWQWIAGYGPVAFVRDLALFGVGPVAAFAMLGWRGAMRWGIMAVPLALACAFVLLMALSSVSALRYGAPALPALAMALAPVAQRVGWRGTLPALAVALWWGAGALRLLDGAHPRILASQWLWTLPQGTVLTRETDWDDGLPTILRLPGDDFYRWPSHDGWFTFQNLDITAPDTPEKARRMAALLAQTDYLVISSDRQFGVMPRLPGRFPMTRAHYAELFSGRACFTLVHEQDRGYPLPGVRMNDLWAQEPWRVYDHPVVRIYRRDACFDAERYARLLIQSLEEARQ